MLLRGGSCGQFNEALLRLTELDISVVVCERGSAPGTWLDLLEPLRERPNPPLLIVISRLADDRLWAEALNLGAWDVVGKPFSASEIARSIPSRPGLIGFSRTCGLRRSTFALGRNKTDSRHAGNGYAAASFLQTLWKPRRSLGPARISFQDVADYGLDLFDVVVWD